MAEREAGGRHAESQTAAPRKQGLFQEQAHANQIAASRAAISIDKVAFGSSCNPLAVNRRAESTRPFA